MVTDTQTSLNITFLEIKLQLLQLEVRTSTKSCVSETRTNEVESHHSRLPSEREKKE